MLLHRLVLSALAAIVGLLGRSGLVGLLGRSGFVGELGRCGLVAPRGRSQGLVEYALIVASVAFVGVAGFNAVSNSEKGYLSGLPMNPPAPSAPGALLHPTNVTASCLPVTPNKVGQPITCTATVTDTFSNSYDLNPPWGSINWYFLNSDGTYTALPGVSGCGVLASQPTTGSSNTCTMTWTPLGYGFLGTRHLVAMYESPRSNHFAPTPSPPLTLELIVNFKWTIPPCVNDVVSGLPAGQVEIGHPIRCKVTLLDGSNGSYIPAQNTNITWTSSSADPGDAVFTCSAPTVAPLLASQACAIGVPIPAPFTCSTDNAGTCEVIYRRLYDRNGGGVTSQPVTLTLTAAPGLGGSYTFNGSAPGETPITVIGPQGAAHPTGIVVFCKSANQWSTPDQHTSFGNVSFGDGFNSGTISLTVSGSKTASLQCTAWVYDTSSANPASDSSKPPNLQESFPPRGTVTFNWYDGTTRGVPATPTTTDGPSTTPTPTPTPTTPLVGASCTLVRADTSTQNPTQYPGQAPFFSSCSVGTEVMNPLVISGTTSDPQQEYINVTYDGEPPGTSGGVPAHAPAFSPVPNAVPGYRFDVFFK